MVRDGEVKGEKIKKRIGEIGRRLARDWREIGKRLEKVVVLVDIKGIWDVSGRAILPFLMQRHIAG